MFQSIMNKHNINNIKLTDDINSILNIMFYTISKKLIKSALKIMVNARRKTLFSSDIHTSIDIIMPQNISSYMCNNGIKMLTKYSVLN
jgi:hypothetical protein